ncbi:unnamed protein product [Staurois parvus]|uniref:Uncharacterized protein n=1 Tax=Staurois parvus TaxID=386267 RepID=A0ABN9D3U3_9NEOB|nr:unnamed protein product [Staurois parvus]
MGPLCPCPNSKKPMKKGICPSVQSPPKVNLSPSAIPPKGNLSPSRGGLTNHGAPEQ